MAAGVGAPTVTAGAGRAVGDEIGVGDGCAVVGVGAVVATAAANAGEVGAGDGATAMAATAAVGAVVSEAVDGAPCLAPLSASQVNPLAPASSATTTAPAMTIRVGDDRALTAAGAEAGWAGGNRPGPLRRRPGGRERIEREQHPAEERGDPVVAVRWIAGQRLAEHRGDGERHIVVVLGCRVQASGQRRIGDRRQRILVGRRAGAAGAAPLLGRR